jgi:uncharacterized membrane protein
MTLGRDRRLEIAMGRMLQIGVMVAALVVLAGGVLYLRQFRGETPDYQKFHGAPAAYESISAIFAGACRFDSASLIAFGILLLIATPICRVIFGLVGFSLLRDRLYTALSAIVLIILFLSFFARR